MVVFSLSYGNFGMSVKKFVERISELPSTATVANPYNCYEEGLDAVLNSNTQRQLHLLRYLRCRKMTAKLILIAEAPGYNGARFSGLAMTSERLLSTQNDLIREQEVFGREAVYQRTSDLNACRSKTVRSGGFAEPTATMVWTEIARAGLHKEVVLWNTFPLHPHKLNRRLSNRRPTIAEIDGAGDHLTMLRDIFDFDCEVVAIGNIAGGHLQRRNINARQVRHPANGGAGEFRAGIRAILRDFVPENR